MASTIGAPVTELGSQEMLEMIACSSDYRSTSFSFRPRILGQLLLPTVSLYQIWIIQPCFYHTGPAEGDLQAQWKQLDDSAAILAMAPDDEILAEIYALQSELIQQMAINRRRSVPILQHVVKDLARQRTAAEVRQEGTEVAKNWILVRSAIKNLSNLVLDKFIEFDENGPIQILLASSIDNFCWTDSGFSMSHASRLRTSDLQLPCHASMPVSNFVVLTVRADL